MKEKLNRLIIEHGRVNLSQKLNMSYVKFMKIYDNTDLLTLEQCNIIEKLLSEIHD